VAINGHSSSGKTSLSRRLAEALPQCSVLHTDDIAWHHGVFSWDELLINDVLPVLRDRRALHYRPPAWVARGRDGAITLDDDRDFVIIEGVGASQASLRPPAGRKHLGRDAAADTRLARRGAHCRRRDLG
jgi:hypothetical protein